jgi:2-polyprenyl-3-methyl-5-hydroxy-6-metoxy-1,4-benzoquinol methylase
VADARARWNRRYSERGVHACEHAPSPWLAEHHALLVGVPGRLALDVACGDGRNAAYLAQLGFEVDAVDVSDVAIDALRAAAAASGLTIHATERDLEAAGLPDGPYDVIVQINYLQRDLFGALAGALAPGGVLVVETFTRADLEELGNGVEARYLLAPGELPAAFPQLEVVAGREAVVDHGARPRAVASLVARRRG